MPKKILVIDDDEGIRAGFAAMLESAGYEVKTAANADSLNGHKKTGMPDLILLDVLLSGLDGRDVCKQLKRQKNTKRIPVIMVSAAPNMEKTIQEANADGFIKKPFEMDELLTVIAGYLE
jgi:DNA-binding response OmpR family regulator